jgi:hypothetical protein
MAYDVMNELAVDTRAGAAKAAAGGIPQQVRTAYRLLLRECVSAPMTAALWDEMINLAAVVNPWSHPERAEAFWRQAAKSPCLARLPARYRTWLELFAAVGARDPERMTALGIALLEAGELTPQQREFAVLSSLSGSLVRSDQASAQRITTTWMPLLTQEQRNSPAFRALRSLAEL